MTKKINNENVKRAPIVVVMGHIDHGKSTLLDYIRTSNIVGGEAGGITQHIGAYEAQYTNSSGEKHNITFLDTPGHEAFCSIRERGAQAADIAILVVSAEDGVKPQTIEAYNEIKKTKIPFIVAINKIDKANANIDKTKQSLGENEIYVEGWGGDIPCVPISATKGTGIAELLDMIVIMSELANLNYNPQNKATGIVIESELDSRKGIAATLLIKDGSITTGSFVIAEDSFAPIRFIEDFRGEKIATAYASMPVVILGWNKIPQCGSKFTIVDTKKEAEKITESFANKINQKKTTNVPLPEIAADKIKPGTNEESGVITLSVAIKADAIGSLDGIKHELRKIKNDKVSLHIISLGIGAINENDIKLIESDPSIILVGFHVDTDKKAQSIIERSAIPLNIKTFNIIYELTQYVLDCLLTKVPKEYEEIATGRAKVLALFSKEKDRQVIGGKVETGIITSGNEVRIIRRDSEIGRGKIRELQEKKARTGEVAMGHEFGVMVESKIEIAVGDRIEAVKTIEKNNV